MLTTYACVGKSPFKPPGISRLQTLTPIKHPDLSPLERVKFIVPCKKRTFIITSKSILSTGHRESPSTLSTYPLDKISAVRVFSEPRKPHFLLYSGNAFYKVSWKNGIFVEKHVSNLLISSFTASICANKTVIKW